MSKVVTPMAQTDLITLLCGLYPLMGNASMQELKGSTLAEISTFFEDQDKAVLTFTGYSGSEYEEPEAMLQIARSVLETFDPDKTIVNIGATRQGIGAVYQLAKQMGFATSGIVSVLARENRVEFSPYVDHIFLIEDDSWGGLAGETGKLSPTSAAMVGASDRIVGIGGGRIGGEEMAAAKLQGIPVRFFPAELNHRIAIEKARQKGLPEPETFAGAAEGML